MILDSYIIIKQQTPEVYLSRIHRLKYSICILFNPLAGWKSRQDLDEIYTGIVMIGEMPLSNFLS